MYVRATVTCECSCVFSADFQTTTAAPICPKCKKQMDNKSWAALKNTMGSLADFNYHILKWSDERNEPRMLVPSLTVCTHEDSSPQDE